MCVGNLTIIISDNGLSPYRCQAIIWTNAGILLIVPLGTNFSEILIEIPAFSFKKMRLKVSSAKRRPVCLGLNVLSVVMNLYKYIICCSCDSSHHSIKQKNKPRIPEQGSIRNVQFYKWIDVFYVYFAAKHQKRFTVGRMAEVIMEMAV